QQQMLQEIFSGDSKEFLAKFSPAYKTTQHGLFEWLESSPQVQELPFVTSRDNINFAEAAFPFSLVGSVPAIHKLFKEYKSDPAIAAEDNKAVFQTQVRNCFWLIDPTK